MLRQRGCDGAPRTDGLGGGAGEAGTQHQVVETGLEVGQHGVTGLAGSTGGLLVSGAKLLLGDAVLSAQTLLFAHTHRVIGLGAAAVTAVLARSVRTLFEDAREPWGSVRCRGRETDAPDGGNAERSSLD